MISAHYNHPTSAVPSHQPNNNDCSIVPVTALALLHQPKRQHIYHLLECPPSEPLPVVPAPTEASFPLAVGITELVGPAGSGKTQLALGLLRQAAAASSTALYLALDKDNIPSLAHRLNQMNANLNNIVLCRVRNEEELLQITPRDFGLIIVDSLAGMFRSTPTVQRSDFLFRLAALWKQWAIPIVVINQLSLARPALGLAWENCVNASFMVDRTTQSGTRTLTVRLSSHMVVGTSKNFVIETTGPRVTTA